MAGFLLLIFIVLMIFIVIKVNGLKYRAKQGVLNKVGLGSSNINSATDSLLEKGNLKKFLASHPTYTEESLKQLLKEIAMEVANRNLTHSADEKVLSKLAEDNKVTKYSNMQIVGCSLFSYVERGNLLVGKVTFSDGKDEYMMFLRFNLIGDECKLIKYQMQKGAVVGF